MQIRESEIHKKGRREISGAYEIRLARCGLARRQNLWVQKTTCSPPLPATELRNRGGYWPLRVPRALTADSPTPLRTARAEPEPSRSRLPSQRSSCSPKPCRRGQNLRVSPAPSRPDSLMEIPGSVLWRASGAVLHTADRSLPSANTPLPGRYN